MRATFDVVIVGGGVIGAATADALVASGVRTALVDRPASPGNATNAAAGILAAQIAPERDESMQRHLVLGRALFKETVSALEDETGINIEYQSFGALKLFASETEREDGLIAAATQRALGLRAAVIDAPDVATLEPELASSPCGALVFPDDHRLNPSCLRDALLARARARGLALIDPSDFAPPINGPIIVLAGGAWSKAIGAKLGVAVPVEPVRGQIVRTAPWSRALRHTVFVRPLGYLLQRSSRAVIAGSTLEWAGFAAEPTPEAVADLQSMARAALPALSDTPFDEAWSGFRPATPDGLPIYDTVNIGGKTVVVVTGHFRSGIVLSLLAGQIADALVRGVPPRADITPFRLSRFAQS